MTEPEPNPDQERPEEIIDEMVGSLADIHTRLVDAASQVGEAQERVEGVRPSWQGMAEAHTADPETAAVYISGVHALSAYRDQLKLLAGEDTSIQSVASIVSGSSDGTSAITAVTHSFFSQGVLSVPPPPPTLPSKEDSAKFEATLRSLDPSLAATYSSIREALYGTRSDPDRAALYAIRQVFDHLFSILAPDDRVRASPYWRPKSEGDPKKVSRDERLRYAANTNAHSPTQARSLIASSRHMLNVYEALNRAHTRGQVDPVRSRSSLREMDALLRQWVSATDLQSFSSLGDASA